jgi:hypothetical protein
MKWLTDLLRIFQPPSAAMMAMKQLEDAQRHLLDAHAYREDAEALVEKYQARVTRLTLSATP